MTSKFAKILLIHTLILLISVIAISIVNYILDAGWILIIIMMLILSPQVIFITVVILYKIFSKKIKANFFLVAFFVFEALGIIFLGLESFNNIFPIIGYALLYISITSNWVILTYYNGTWGKYKQKSKKNV